MDNADAGLKNQKEETDESRSEPGEVDITDLNQMNKIVLKAIELRKEEIHLPTTMKQDPPVDHGEFCIKPRDNGEHAELVLVF